MNPTPINGARWLVNALQAEGVTTLYGYPGGTIMPFYDALLGSSLKHVLVRHEQGAALAANGYARRSGQVGVCVATSGPGASNLVTGIADALLDSVPMVCITGQVPTAVMGTDAFQELDVFGVTMPVVKHSFLVRDIKELPDAVHQAFQVARSGRPGPVLIDLPKDVQLADASALPVPKPLSVPAMTAPSAEALVAALAEISKARRPLIYGGGGIHIAGAVEDFRGLVNALRLPTVLTLRALGVLPSEHPLLLGMLGMHGSQAANLAVQECDLLIVVGARFDDRATGKLSEFAPNARVIHLDGDAGEINKLRQVHISLHGDLPASLRTLTAAVPQCQEWRAHCTERARASSPRYDAPGNLVYAPALLRQLSRQLPDAVVCCDVGQHQMWVAQHWNLRHPANHLSSAGLGTMGFGLPAAIGAQMADPDATVINVTGDGSFQMNLQELATVAREQLPIKIVMLDNQALGMVRQWQELFFDKRFSAVDLSDNPDFCAIAKAYGIHAWSIDRRDQVTDALTALLAHPGPALLQVAIDQAANVWPLVPPNKNNAEMMTANPSLDSETQNAEDESKNEPVHL